MGLEFSSLPLLFLALRMCYWLFFNGAFYFSSLFYEKIQFNFIIIIFFVFLILKVLRVWALKTMLLLDVVYKKLWIEKIKISRGVERGPINGGSLMIGVGAFYRLLFHAGGLASIRGGLILVGAGVLIIRLFILF